MELPNKENLQKQAATLRSEFPKMERGLKERHRILRLMEAGLEQMPLERDFVELYRYKLTENERQFELAKQMLVAADEALRDENLKP